LKRFVLSVSVCIVCFFPIYLFGSTVGSRPERVVELSVGYQSQDTTNLRYQLPSGDPTAASKSPLFLQTPSNTGYIVEFNPVTGKYVFYEKIGDRKGLAVRVMSQDEYAAYQQAEFS